MYQLNETIRRWEYRRGLPQVPANVPHLWARQSETDQPDGRVRVVRVPGGFAFVEEKAATGGS